VDLTRLRHREFRLLAGIEMVSWSSGPALGNVRAGAVASAAGLRASVVSGGILCVVGTLALVLALPRFWSYERSEAEAQVS
jgi:MFS family permease